MTSLSSRCEINNLNKIAQLLSYSNVCVSIWLVSIYTLKMYPILFRAEMRGNSSLLYPSYIFFPKVFLMRLRKSLDNNNNPVRSSLVHVLCCYCSSFFLWNSESVSISWCMNNHYCRRRRRHRHGKSDRSEPVPTHGFTTRHSYLMRHSEMPVMWCDQAGHVTRALICLRQVTLLGGEPEEELPLF